ncbi:hypothetical protein CLCOS_39780 [Clostridium coskatii]|uniref:Transposase DDE domain-containing protein n=2 Tax=Clostridium coskatii TaxID=1705578 RepID=A0A166TL50_9CLOT|nr:hypothetical protein [Clostridium coskatii]OAA93827.1 hypothetical protein WX73_04049 [Clostridium coskatii]OBR90525.1 hypothetical protein CLCOS_39780 [Clostridium coskatii]
MLRNWIPHLEYQEQLYLKMLLHYEMQKSRLVALDKSISKLYLLNLDSLLPVIKPLYSDLGRPAKNQQGIIRSLVLMLDQQEHSITNWAKKIAFDPLILDICGFEDGVPSASSYYDFLVRLWILDHKLHVERKLKVKSFSSKPRKKLKAGEKQPPKHSGTVKKLVDKALGGKLRNFCPETIFQKFIARCVVDTSSNMGILGDINNLSVAFDGSPFYSGASHYGVKVCDCKSKGIYNCHCPRRYSDPDARWGWDSYREQWFFGNTLFNVTASDSPYDLPIYIKMVQASRHDSITTVFALESIHNLYPDLHFKNFIADGAMDNYPTYELLKRYDILPFISLDSRTKAKFDYPHPDILCFDGNGNPICMGGIPFANWGYSKPKGIKYRCYFAVKGLEPPAECKCSNSKYGKVIHIKPDYDPRMFPPVPRSSEKFKDKFKTRTSVERSNKRMFNDYDIEEYKSRSAMLRMALATFSVINIHLDAWIKHTGFSFGNLIQSKTA